MSDFIHVSYPEAGVALVTLNRPDRMNAMAFDVMVPLREALETISFDNTIRVVILTGAGEGFCAGADLKDPGYLPIFDNLSLPAIARRAMRVLDDVMHTIQAMHQPVIAAINGPAIGGGFCLAMMCDIRIASPEAIFRAAGINNGLTSAELGLSYTLPRAIGTGRAFEIMLTGRDVDAAEAERLGITSRTVAREQLLDEALITARQMLRHSHIGVELSKQMLWASLSAASLQTHMNHEGHAQLFVRMTTDNFDEAIRARKQGRAPEFKA